jgi:hypothetical protein
MLAIPDQNIEHGGCTNMSKSIWEETLGRGGALNSDWLVCSLVRSHWTGLCTFITTVHHTIIQITYR